MGHVKEGGSEVSTEFPMTLGQQRVRVNFNVSGDDTVSLLKKKSAKLIDICNEMKPTKVELNAMDIEKIRLIALAQTAYEEAAMWAVKAATM